jgi:hypothetical protein
MNIHIIRTLAIVCLGAAFGTANLMAQVPMKFTIPFDFTVGSKSFAAGDYTVRPGLANSVVMIQSADYRSSIMALTDGLQTQKPLPQGQLVFHRDGNRNFLSQVWTHNYGRALPISKAEKELIAQVKSQKPVTLVASSTQ